jgi:beta-lactamase superfamily II metal-dependent hydrolase
VYNLSSIVVLAEQARKRMLLTGDALGRDILDGLENTELLKRGVIDVDVLKLPHHGSDRNVDTDFFRRVRADHYVISANGKHGNPDTPTLDMILEARGSRKITLWFTNRTGHDGLATRLKKVVGNAHKGVSVKYRDASKPSFSIRLG